MSKLPKTIDDRQEAELWYRNNRDEILSTEEIGFPWEIAERSGNADVRRALLECALRDGRHVRSVELIGIADDSGKDMRTVTIGLSRSPVEEIEFYNRMVTGSGSRVPHGSPEKILQWHTRTFAQHGLSAYLQEARRLRSVSETTGWPEVPLADVADISNGGATIIGEREDGTVANGREVDAVEVSCLDLNMVCNSNIITTAPAKKFVRRIKQSAGQGRRKQNLIEGGPEGAPIQRLEDAIVVKALWYRANQETQWQSAAIVRGPIECAVASSLHVIQLDSFCPPGYLEYLLLHWMLKESFLDQLVQLTDTRVQVTLDGLRRMVVPAPYSTDLINARKTLQIHRRTVDNLVSLKARDPSIDLRKYVNAAFSCAGSDNSDVDKILELEAAMSRASRGGKSAQ